MNKQTILNTQDKINDAVLNMSKQYGHFYDINFVLATTLKERLKDIAENTNSPGCVSLGYSASFLFNKDDSDPELKVWCFKNEISLLESQIAYTDDLEQKSSFLKKIMALKTNIQDVIDNTEDLQLNLEF